MALKIEYEKRVTVDDIVAEATAIWKKCGGVYSDETLSLVQKSNREFCTSYPIVARYLCQLGIYDSQVLRRWLQKIAKKPWKSEDDYIDAQATYISMLYRTKNPRAGVAEINAAKEAARKILANEMKMFKGYIDKARELVDKKEAAMNAEKMRELAAFMRKMRGDCAGVAVQHSLEEAAGKVDTPAASLPAGALDYESL